MMIKKITEILKNNSTAILISSPQNRRYFTEFSSSDGYLVIMKNDAVFFTDSRYTEAAQKAISACKTQGLTRVSKEIKEYLQDNNIEKILVERDNLTVGEFEALKVALSPVKITASKALEKKISALRAVKNKEEIKCIKQAQKIAENAFNHILKFIKPGVTEKEIALELDFYMLSHGAESISFETIAVTGAKTSMPHGVPDNTVVKKGDFVTMDFGAVYKGYHSDMTRTVAVGEVSSEQRKVYEIVLEAQLKGLNALKCGVSCKQADAAARNVIESAGYGGYFGHGTGHGVGIEIHEGPNLSPRSESVLKVNNVVTVEPGIYIPGKFGVRIEDMARIKRNGYENLTKSPKELIILDV